MSRLVIACYIFSVSIEIDELSILILGGLAIAVPGEVRGMYEAWKKHGKLPWKELVQPTINMTQRGFQVPQRMHQAAHILRYHVESDPGLR